MPNQDDYEASVFYGLKEIIPKIMRKNMTIRLSIPICRLIVFVNSIVIIVNACYAYQIPQSGLGVIVWTPVAIADFPATILWISLNKLDLNLITVISDLLNHLPLSAQLLNILTFAIFYLLIGNFIWYKFCRFLNS